MVQEKTFPIDLEGNRIIFDYVSNGVMVTDKHSTILYANPSFTKITGYSRHEAVGENPGILHSGCQNKDFYKDMWHQILTQGFWEGEIWNRRKSGEIYPEYLTISMIPGTKEDNGFYISIFSDISFLREDAEKKYHLAFYDPLTKLPNRTLYLDRLRHLLVKADKENIKIAIFYMDLDKFKQVNDTYGHVVGDVLLQKVGQRLSALVRAGDTVARMGGDEFTAILMLNDGNFLASQFAERILKSIEKPFLIEGNSIDISISIGASFYPRDAKSIDGLLSNADKAMYRAKKTGIKIVCNDPSRRETKYAITKA